MIPQYPGNGSLDSFIGRHKKEALGKCPSMNLIARFPVQFVQDFIAGKQVAGGNHRLTIPNQGREDAWGIDTSD
jgi:hypothetical protein